LQIRILQLITLNFGFDITVLNQIVKHTLTARPIEVFR
jgi:hypothetical protein